MKSRVKIVDRFTDSAKVTLDVRLVINSLREKCSLLDVTVPGGRISPYLLNKVSVTQAHSITSGLI